jgi:hypothetical protein
MDARLQKLVTAFEQQGWLLKGSVDISGDWWFQDIIQLVSTWRPTDTNIYLTLLTDLQYLDKKIVWCIGISSFFPALSPPYQTFNTFNPNRRGRPTLTDCSYWHILRRPVMPIAQRGIYTIGQQQVTCWCRCRVSANDRLQRPLPQPPPRSGRGTRRAKRRTSRRLRYGLRDCPSPCLPSQRHGRRDRDEVSNYCHSLLIVAYKITSRHDRLRVYAGSDNVQLAGQAA